MRILGIQDTHICKIYGVDCNSTNYLLVIYLSIDIFLLGNCNYWTIRVLYLTDEATEVKIHYNMFEEFHSAYVGGLEKIIEHENQ